MCASSSTACSAYYSCSTKSPVLIFQLPRYSVYLRCTRQSPVLSFQLHSLLRVLQWYYKAATPAFRALDTHDLRRGVPDQVQSHSRLHFAHSTRTISAEGCAGQTQIALSPALCALDTHDLRRGLRRTDTNRTLACTSRTRHARSPQRVAPDRVKSHSRLHFAHSTRTISAETRTTSAEGWAGQTQIALSPAFRALDTHDLRRGLRFVVLRRYCPRP